MQTVVLPGKGKKPIIIPRGVGDGVGSGDWVGSGVEEGVLVGSGVEVGLLVGVGELVGSGVGVAVGVGLGVVPEGSWAELEFWGWETVLAIKSLVLLSVS